MGLKNRLPNMSEKEALEMLSTHGNLVKRPFVIGDGAVLVGFKEPAWKSVLLK
jgi:arsenate reductase-like glutaredoxin family protein